MCFLQVHSYDPEDLKAALRGNSEKTRKRVVDYKVTISPLANQSTLAGGCVRSGEAIRSRRTLYDSGT